MNRIKVLVSRAMEASGPSGGAGCTLWGPVPCGQVQLLACIPQSWLSVSLEDSSCCLLSFNEVQVCLVRVEFVVFN